eukprot:CAMPEP_0182926054 /NCGR_PEP_ID=MMETSP0105_2-20130417/10800_1 /TAXON_ID=81532 ORGANISM="Acanthoeca-like sp., Strain 10tr" /NCGR_SAMPLE_ID=MMETSP0105_2 /ASSEMBLY_ACC=CAM_ASM_000205 /LENGTH=182 /DNA_ID=CAMNT_0025063927 /DNA_START=21 /DNA_END=569 /DNA_ORIENTATION=-
MATVTIGAVQEGIKDAASMCTKAVDLLKHHTPQPFNDLLEPASELADLLPNITKFGLGGTAIPGMPDIVAQALEAVDVAEMFIKKVVDTIGCLIEGCWDCIDSTWDCVWGIFTSVVTLPDLSILSTVGQLVRQILSLFKPLIDAAMMAANAAAGLVGDAAGALIDNAPGPVGDVARGLRGLF